MQTSSRAVFLVLVLAALAVPAAARAQARAPSTADELVRMLVQTHLGFFAVESTRVGASGAKRQRYVERAERTGHARFVTRLYDEAGQLFWTSHWTIEAGGAAGELRLLERWADGRVTRYRARYEDGVLSAEGTQPDGTHVRFRTNFLGSALVYYREESRDGRVRAMQYDRLTPIRGERPALSSR